VKNIGAGDLFMTSHNEGSIEQKLNQWLNTQGYPLEMTTAAFFQKRNFQVSLSDYYVDFETRETREIDITAILWSNMQSPVAVQVCFRIECKQSKDKPWVVFIPETQRDFPFPPLDVFSSKAIHAFWLDKMQDRSFSDILITTPLLQVKRYGYGLTQAFTTSVDIPYRATLSAVKASIDRVTEMENILHNHQGNGTLMCCVVVPVIVIDGRLFECSIDKEQNTHLQEVQTSRIQWKGTNPLSTYPIVHLTTKAGLEKFTEECQETAEKIITLAQNNMEELRFVASIFTLGKNEPQ